MHNRFSRRAFGVAAVAAVLFSASPSQAVFFPLGPSKNEWGLKYEVQLTEAGGDMVNVALTVADEGRLGPVYSYTVVAFSPRGGGSQAYDVKSKIELKPTADGRRTGQVQVRREFVVKGMIRLLTLRVDGKPQTAGAALYDIPLNRYTIAAAPAGSLRTTKPSAVAPQVAKPSVSAPFGIAPSVTKPSAAAPSAVGPRYRQGRLF